MKILVIRRDNIGDLVCTTPLLRSLRHQLPQARIEVLATRYNRAVLDGNPDIDALHAYVKAKHRNRDESLLEIFGRRAQTVLELRRRRFDWVLLPGGASASATRLARWIAPRSVAREAEAEAQNGTDRHEVERCCRLLTAMGLEYETPAARVVAQAGLTAAMGSRIAAAWCAAPRLLVGLHISSRKPSQRWPAERFGELARRLHVADSRLGFVLLWAPGSEDNPLHPGDDEKVVHVVAAAGEALIVPVPTHSLEELIAALSLCDVVVCGDGGAMHLAAGLGKSVVALFGQSDVDRWHPWGVPQQIIQKPSQNVADIEVGEVLQALERIGVGAEREHVA